MAATRPRPLAAVAALLLGGCTTTAPADTSDAVLGSGILANAAGASIGTVRIVASGEGPQITVAVSSMPPGTYGTHLHAIGRCDPPAFTSAGPHWNPTSRQHGRLNPQGTHHGDLPNLVVAANGSGTLTAPVAGALSGAGGLFDPDGAALLVHARADDERTDPSGNSGDRIACATLSPQ